MKRKILIITASILILGVLLCISFYFFYLKKAVIYDLKNIEFSGIPQDDISAIKIYGTTPVNKKIAIGIFKKTESRDIPGCFKTIEFVTPDTLVSKITCVRVILKEKTYTLKISDLHSTLSSKNVRCYVLPPEVKSKGTFFNKLSSAYPYKIVLQIFKIFLPLLLILIIIFCIIYVWKFTKILQKSFAKKFIAFLKDKKIKYLFFFVILIILSVWPILWPNQIKIIYFLVILLFISIVVQSIFKIKKSYVLYLFRVFIMIFLYFEIVFGILNSKKISQEIYGSCHQMKDNLTGYTINKPDGIGRSIATFGADTIYDVHYYTDEYGRRIKDGINKDTLNVNNNKKKHAIFLGCSLTFGVGLNDSSTFPFLFECLHPDYKSYNYGVGGYGPSQICFLFDDGINTINNKNIAEDSGFCMYTFIDDHLNRVYGSSDYFSWSGDTPDVYVDNNKLVCKKRSSIQKNIAWFLNNSETLKYFNISFKYPRKEKFYRRFADIINYTAQKYWNIKPYGKFYVGIYPGESDDISWIRFLNIRIMVLNIPPPLIMIITLPIE